MDLKNIAPSKTIWSFGLLTFNILIKTTIINNQPQNSIEDQFIYTIQLLPGIYKFLIAYKDRLSEKSKRGKQYH
jgi:hypothetical protein